MDHNISLKRPHYFFTTTPTPCPYISGRLERKVLTELNGPDAQSLHDSLSKAGFRRSHSVTYSPACPGCSACVAVRVVVDHFQPDKSMLRTLKINKHLQVTKSSARATVEQYVLFNDYQKSRHSDGEMSRMRFYDYKSMVEDSPVESFITQFHHPDGDLEAVALVDVMSDGLSAVYSFFNPTTKRESYGTYMILWMIEEAKRLGLPYVYLGYWIADSKKMMYKQRFKPLEAFGPGGWLVLD